MGGRENSVGLFESALTLGLVGLIVMLVMQMHHGHADSGDLSVDGGGMHLDSGDVGAGHAGFHIDTAAGHHAGVDAGAGHHAGVDAGAGHGHVDHAGADAGHTDASAHGHDVQHGEGATLMRYLWLIPSPVMIFAWLIGFGLAGLIAEPMTRYTYALVWAVVGGTVFQKFIIRPYWNCIFRFASKPADLLEGTLAHRALAVTSFDSKGCGLVRLDVDGQTRDVLARLVPQERGVPVRKGEYVLVERVNTSDNTVLVSRSRYITDGGKV